MKIVVVLVALYLLVDFSDPGLPGVFVFAADESVEAAQSQRLDVVPPPAAVVASGDAVSRLLQDSLSAPFAVAMPPRRLPPPPPTSLDHRRVTPAPPEDSPAAPPAA